MSKYCLQNIGHFIQVPQVLKYWPRQFYHMDIELCLQCSKQMAIKPQWVNSVPPYVRKLHFMYEAIRTSGKCRWNIYRTSSKCRWSIYRTSRKRRGTLRIVHKVERSSPTVKTGNSAASRLQAIATTHYAAAIWAPFQYKDAVLPVSIGNPIKTVERSFYFQKGISCNDKTISLYWTGVLVKTLCWENSAHFVGYFQ